MKVFIKMKVFKSLSHIKSNIHSPGKWILVVTCPDGQVAFQFLAHSLHQLTWHTWMEPASCLTVYIPIGGKGTRCSTRCNP